MNVTAYLNWGRWLIDCPTCKTALLAREHTICLVCFPHIEAKALRDVGGGLLRPVDDVELIEQAREQARKAGAVLEPVYPAERNAIEAILRVRPDRSNFNWLPGETLDDLRLQNIQHGDPVPEV